MKILDMKVADLIPYANNPRNNAGAVDALAASIKAFGFKQPLVIDKDKVIVCGHTRFEASKKLKLETVPCVVADDLTPAQIKAYRLADNKVAELAEWDITKLDLEMADIDIDMAPFGLFPKNYDDDQQLDVLDEEREGEQDVEMFQCPQCGHINSKRAFRKND